MNKFSIFRHTAAGLFIQVFSMLLAITMAINPLLANNFKPIGIKQTESVEFASSLGRGWNLGGTLDATNFSVDNSVISEIDADPLWCNPYVTKDMIQFVKNTGFDFVRIPVTWRNHFKMDDGYEIDEAWLDKVQQIADWSLECGLKVIVNTHHDTTMNEENLNPWFIDDEEHYESTKAITVALWGQIAERFKDYDENLIFEIFNEPSYFYAKYKGHGNDESRYVLNKLNMDAFETIRAAGGNNGTRYVLFPTHGAVNDYQCSSVLELPDDPHVLVSVHCYVLEKHNIWAKMLMIQKFFLNKGYGTVITEFGSDFVDENDNYRHYSLDNEEDRKIIDGIADTYTYYTNIADKFHIPCCVWDDGSWFRLLNRKELSWDFPQIIKALTGTDVQ